MLIRSNLLLFFFSDCFQKPIHPRRQLQPRPGWKTAALWQEDRPGESYLILERVRRAVLQIPSAVPELNLLSVSRSLP